MHFHIRRFAVCDGHIACVSCIFRAEKSALAYSTACNLSQKHVCLIVPAQRPTARSSDRSNEISATPSLDFLGTKTDGDGVAPDEHSGTDEDYRIDVNLPGVPTEEVTIDTDNNQLTVRGDRVPREPTDGRTVIRRERTRGPFFRRVSFPSPST